MTKAYSYSRFSSRAQAEGDSLRRQLEAAYTYAENHGLDLDTTLQDLGVSAYSGANRTKGALKSFLDRVERGEIAEGSFLLIDSMDRLSRQDVTQATHQLLGITLAGITVVTLNDGRTLDRNATMADVMMAVIEIERSHRESEEKGRKVAMAHEKSKAKAREEGRVWHRTGPTWLRYDDLLRRFVPIPEKVAVVRRVFDLIETGLGTTAIAQRLNAENVPPPRGKLKDGDKGGWHHSAVLEVAKNRSVLGEYQPKKARGGNRATRRPNDGEAIPGYYGEGVVSEDQFNRVQAIIASRKPRKGRGQNTKVWTNLFIGMGQCASCGGRIGMHTAAKHATWNRASVLRCNNSVRGLCDAKRRFPYAELERNVLTFIQEFSAPDGQRDDLQDRLTTLRHERTRTEERIQRLLDLIEDGDSTLKGRLRVRETELDNLNREIVDVESARAQQGVAVPVADRQEAIRQMVARMDTLEGSELYELRASISTTLSLIISEMTFHGGPRAPRHPFFGPDRHAGELDDRVVIKTQQGNRYQITPRNVVGPDDIRSDDPRPMWTKLAA